MLLITFQWYFFFLSCSFLRRKGIVVNETAVLLYGQLLTGRKYVPKANGAVELEKQWAKQILPFAFQTVVKVHAYTQERNIQLPYIETLNLLIIFWFQVGNNRSQNPLYLYYISICSAIYTVVHFLALVLIIRLQNKIT